MFALTSIPKIIILGIVTKIFTICFNIIIKTPISIISMFSVFFTKISFNLNSVIKTIISYTHEPL